MVKFNKRFAKESLLGIDDIYSLSSPTPLKSPLTI